MRRKDKPVLQQTALKNRSSSEQEVECSLFKTTINAVSVFLRILKMFFSKNLHSKHFSNQCNGSQNIFNVTFKFEILQKYHQQVAICF